jgi:hypothetical protein
MTDFLINPNIEQQLSRTVGDILAEEAAQTQAAETPTQAGLPEYLTPESLVAYCDSRLTSLDAQMQTIFNQQQTNAATETALSNVASALNDLPQPSGTDTTVKVSLHQMGALEVTYQQAIAAAGGAKTSLGQSLQKDLDAITKAYAPGSSEFYVAGHNPSEPISVSVINNASQNVKTYASNLNSDSQVSMIDLQSMMSQQQTAVELSTNLIQALGQISNDISSNMKDG